ncbi:NADPH-dependent FMN reductase [Streptomyces atratus]|uniref:NADPH-dependent FMN reductase n=1 Tax=Streptomyces atratus TaxID=1893 RepID=UPI00224FD25E|nr:NAD(P)H-dependent oxidoreductase [Streptomyces atratus]MCX5339792.1 NAD(P)H-dependent oxidoreductase [Streptomyces atratus]
MTRIAVILGSTRPGRRGEAVARWTAEVAARHPAAVVGQVTFELVDLAKYALPLLDEPVPAMFGQYQREATRRWAAAIGSFDGFVFVTPEYNHSMTAALKNAIDHLFAEWNDKAAGFVSYGVHGGTRAVEHLRLALAEVKVAGVRSQVVLSVFTDFDYTGCDMTDPTAAGEFRPGSQQEPTMNTMLDEVIAWSVALKPLRANATADSGGDTVPAV